MKWISIKEKLPKPIKSTSGSDIENTYLVSCDTGGWGPKYELAHYWENSGWRGVDGSCGFDVTHWARLPKEPIKG